jgi:F-type H+-transporting ATPase subunit delta
VIGYTLAKRYAQALIDLAREEKRVEEVAGQVGSLAAAFDPASGLVEFFSNPTIPSQAKGEALEQLLAGAGASGLAADFARLLLAKNRLLGLPEIVRAYGDLWDGLQNRVRARLVTALPLGAEETERARKALAALSGKDVVLAVEVDPGIIGGLVAYVGSQVYDGSVKNQLIQFADSMHKGR